MLLCRIKAVSSSSELSLLHGRLPGIECSEAIQALAPQSEGMTPLTSQFVPPHPWTAMASL